MRHLEHIGHYLSRAVGDIAKTLVRDLLEGCGYEIHPFGYESFMTDIKDRIQRGEVYGPSVNQLKSMPDLIAVDRVNRLVELIEVKYRSRVPENVGIQGDIIARYLEYWPESKLLIVVPYREVFYSAKICKGDESGKPRLELKEGGVGINSPRFDERKKELNIDPYSLSRNDIVDFTLKEGDRIEEWFHLVKENPSVLKQMRKLALEVFENERGK